MGADHVMAGQLTAALACALAHQAARSGFSVLYVRATRLFDELQVAHGDGSLARRLAQLAILELDPAGYLLYAAIETS